MPSSEATGQAGRAKDRRCSCSKCLPQSLRRRRRHLAAPSQAQDYPNRVIRIIHGFPPGGNVDLIARILANEMEKALGQSIVVEAKPGIAGALAAETVARGDADGYTLLVVPSAHPAYGALAKNVKFKVVDDFTWISVASFYPFMIA